MLLQNESCTVSTKLLKIAMLDVLTRISSVVIFPFALTFPLLTQATLTQATRELHRSHLPSSTSINGVRHSRPANTICDNKLGFFTDEYVYRGFCYLENCRFSLNNSF